MTGDLQRKIQNFFQDGLVAVVGLGHSASQGLPTMPELAAGLRASLPDGLSPEEAEEWQVVEQALDSGDHLEKALDSISHESPLVDPIIATTAALILEAEQVAIDQLSRGERRFPLAELLPLMAVGGTAKVITTNYDRLVELAAEVAGFFLDTGFVGAHYAVCDPSLSHEALRSGTLKRRKNVKLEYRPHVILAKPHGSLDWYAHGDTPIRSPYPLTLPRLMITPGESKYHRGYEQPFDHHINLGNRAVDSATGILAIGFGFNDSHLQKHVEPKIKQGLPCLMLTRDLTGAATELLEASPNVVAIEQVPPNGTRVHSSGGYEDFPDSSFWQLDQFIDEVLK